MSINPVVAPFPIFQDRDGQPLEAGFVYVGVANLDPVTNPIVVYWDSALTITAAQPVRTLNGYASRNGAPGALFADSDFSITVKDKQGVLVVTNATGARSGLGDIVLASGESLTAQSGSSIDVEDGAAVSIGTATGVGVLVTLASNARFVGNIVPNATGTQSLGSATRKWDAQLDLATVTTVAATTIGATTVNGATVTGYNDTTTTVTATQALALNQQKNVVACGRISSAGVISTNHFNIASASVVGNTIVAVLDTAVEDDVVIICQPTGTGSGLECQAAVSVSGTTITFVPYSGGVAGVLNISFVAFGRPRGGVIQP